MYCTYCGHQNRAGTKFCVSCGRSLVVTPVSTQTYCTHCGRQNRAGTKFCASCGQPLVATPVSTRASPPTPLATSTPIDRSRWLRRLPSIGAALVVWGFFLPWVLVSCSVDFGASDIGFEASGYEIASGNFAVLNQLQEYSWMLGYSEEAYSQEADTPALWLILVLGLAGLLALQGRAAGSALAILAGILGAIGMTIVTVRLTGAVEELSRQGLRLQFREGFWITWLGFIWLASTGLMTVRQKR